MNSRADGKIKEERKRERFPRSLSLPSPPRCVPNFLCAVPSIWMPLTGLRAVRFAYVIWYSLASHTLRSGAWRVWDSTSVRSGRRFTTWKPVLRKKRNNNNNDGDSFPVYLSFNRIQLSITLTALWRQVNGSSLEQLAERSENGYFDVPNVWNRITERHIQAFYSRMTTSRAGWA